MCEEGCFDADQKILFGERKMTLEDAAVNDISKFTSLAPEASIFSLDLKNDTEIKHYTAGFETENLIRISIEDGRSIRVTLNHPLVSSSGELFPAKEASVGTMLLTTEGAKSVSGVELSHDDRRVWHIMPVSPEPKDNIVIAEGIFTGSARFQQKWAEEKTRFLLRNNLERTTVNAF